MDAICIITPLLSADHTRLNFFSSFCACSEYDVCAIYCVLLFPCLSLRVYFYLLFFLCSCLFLFLCSPFPLHYVCVCIELSALIFHTRLLSHIIHIIIYNLNNKFLNYLAFATSSSTPLFAHFFISNPRTAQFT